MPVAGSRSGQSAERGGPPARGRRSSSPWGERAARRQGRTFSPGPSASRAALLEAWKRFQSSRQWLAREFCQPVYEQFLTEAVALGRIEAPGFLEDPVLRRAWCGADWNGPAQGMLDPTKEVQAAQQRVENGFSTREEETIGLTGGNFKRNAKQLKRENQMLKEAEGGSMPSEEAQLDIELGTGE